MATETPAQIETVGDLRRVIEGVSDDLPVKVHCGWDLLITEWDVDGEGLVLFPDDVAGVSFVGTDWLYREHPELKAGQ